MQTARFCNEHSWPVATVMRNGKRIIINFYGKIGAGGSEWAVKNTLVADGAPAPFI